MKFVKNRCTVVDFNNLLKNVHNFPQTLGDGKMQGVSQLMASRNEERLLQGSTLLLCCVVVFVLYILLSQKKSYTLRHVEVHMLRRVASMQRKVLRKQMS
eukprot:TRINITY_DN376_c0_g1_i3.p6 TRINITY_DN376_c0_g1~~TRINITY_DN376_c0_g1_i3.p6  ORF type:complete len:100 (-),score=13.19 TRINITY_DN376_c0_g1_i3:1144-1443(-)